MSELSAQTGRCVQDAAERKASMKTKGESMLEVCHLAHGFGRQPALWEIPHLRWRGESLVHLQGDNGSGKTTLMRLLAGLEMPRQGTVRWSLDDASAQPPPCPGRLLYLHQQPYLFDTTVAGNLHYIARWNGWRGEAMHRRIDEMLERCGLAEHVRQRARSLSGGERMRLALARAWLLSPRVLLLDEPTASLDRQAVRDVAALVGALHASGCAVVLSAHQPSELTERCDEHWYIAHQRLGVATREAPLPA
ncbi:energy-coupling factor ABC transporter ATP-binding protein [Chromohalobacter sp.]|uniref:energy-coupling factor ABC transporter ATP-binding protein n=1 Tax=Chromohalobacter sp. TaxID=50740 RepID=UPI001D3AB494|nr:energy-coupling factor ABC transporter ATP-binding protein [Chromohalobacter sp.]NQY46219.1 energy-coupling factor ABC transporter ATP-binding protein [Chromohalobacter sp.]